MFVGIDVGTGSARAGVFDRAGNLLGSASRPIATHKPQADFVEQDSDDIFRACGEATRAALKEAGVSGEAIEGVGFDATCSLVVLDADHRPVTVSPTGDDRWNVIVWMDHRAIPQAARIDATKHEVLRYVGGTISPEMETPKLLWLKEHLPTTWKRAAKFLDLPDFLTFRATGVDVRSLCTTVCKWTYLGHEAGGGWQKTYFDAIGLGDLASEGFARIGTVVRPMGEPIGTLTAEAAAILGLSTKAKVGVSIIDAHAGGVGILGAELPNSALENRVALIGGTSTCHMAISKEPRFVPGVWGPYFSAMIPGYWLTEGGQSATGALIDHVIDAHARGRELRDRARAEGTTAYALLNARLDTMHAPFPAALAKDLHVLPDHHGNRSPRADATLRGMISGLALRDDVDALAVEYLATIQAIAHGTRHVLDAMNAAGYAIDMLVASGGDTKNPVFLREHADVTGCRIALPETSEGVLLGSAILGAVAAGAFPSIVDGMRAMSRASRILAPNPTVRAFHDKKHQVFLRMYDDQMAYRSLMA
ncbi:MAG: FGGY-family carbohydrate kinase [Polyangiales bacterium]